MIRPVTADDFAAWLPLWDAYNAHYGRSGDTALPAEITRTTWTRFLAPDEPMYALVHDDAGALVGLAHYLFHRTTTAIADTCYLQDLYVDPAARNRGIATALIRAVAECAHGAKRLYWQTLESNETARRVYDHLAERSGFIVYRMALPNR